MSASRQKKLRQEQAASAPTTKRRAVTVAISDVNDADAFNLSSENCRVMKMPDLTRNKEQSTITVNIYAPSVVPR